MLPVAVLAAKFVLAFACACVKAACVPVVNKFSMLSSKLGDVDAAAVVFTAGVLNVLSACVVGSGELSAVVVPVSVDGSRSVVMPGFNML